MYMHTYYVYDLCTMHIESIYAHISTHTNVFTYVCNSYTLPNIICMMPEGAQYLRASAHISGKAQVPVL